MSRFPLDARRSVAIREELADRRGGRVVFLSHCLLNQNVRYLGGASCPGPVAELLNLLEETGVGVVQMSCPEEAAWGGVLKPRLLAAYGAGRRWWFRYRRPLVAAGLAWTRHVYRRLARRVMDQIIDYQRNDIEVVAMVGVGGSPSCGVLSTLDVARALDSLAAIDPERICRDAFNRDVIAAHVTAGQGMFTQELTDLLRKRRMQVPFLDHDLLAELSGGRSTVVQDLRDRLVSPPLSS